MGAGERGLAMLLFADIDANEVLLNQARQAADGLLRDFPDAAQGHFQPLIANKHDYLRV